MSKITDKLLKKTLLQISDLNYHVLRNAYATDDELEETWEELKKEYNELKKNIDEYISLGER